MKTIVAMKKKFPATNCHPCSWSSGGFVDTTYEWGTHQIGAITNTSHVTPARTGPFRGRSRATASHTRTGTIHTM